MRGLNAIASILLLCGLLFAVPITQTVRKSAMAPSVWPGWGGPRGNFTSTAALRLVVEVRQHQDRVIDLPREQSHEAPKLRVKANAYSDTPLSS